jgi:hypothetical protein
VGNLLTGNRVRLDEMDFSDRLVKIEDEEVEMKISLISRLISKFRN